MRKILSLSVACFCLAFRAGADLPPADKILPDDTLIMFTIPDFNQLRDAYQNSSHGLLWNDPSMKTFKDKFIGKLSDVYITPLEHDLGVHFSDYTNLPQGQLTLAFIQNGWQPKNDEKPAILFFLDTKTKSSQLKSNLVDLKKKWVDSGKTIKTETIRGVDFSVITLSREDLPKTLKKPDPGPNAPEPFENPALKNLPKGQLYVGQSGSLLILCNSSKAIEKTLAQIAGGEVKSLSDSPAYSPSSGLFRNSQLSGWVNSKAFFDIVASRDADSDPDSPSVMPFKPEKLISASGLNGLRSVAFTYAYSNDGAQANLSLAVPAANRIGLFTIIAGVPKDTSPPPFVPADAIKFQRWRMDGQKTWETLRKIAGDINPSYVGSLDFVLGSVEAAAKEKDPSFDLKKNLFGNLGDDLVSYQKAPRGTTMADLSSPPAIFLIGSPNAEQLATGLKSLMVLSQPSADATDRDFLGHKIHSMPFPGAPNGGPAKQLLYASGGGYLAISADAGLIEEFLRNSENQGKALRDTPGLADAMQKVVDSGTSLFGYANESESMRVMYNIAKKNAESADPLAGLAPLASVAGLSDFKTSDWLDLSLLPDFNQVAKYFYFTVYSESVNADGLTFKFFAPTPPQLKK